MKRIGAAALLVLLAGCASGGPIERPVGAPPPDPAAAGRLKQPADATVLPSGLAYKILKPGNGSGYPAPSDGITVNYTLWLPDGAELESTCGADGRCAPRSFSALSAMIKGWQQALPLMTIGEKLRLWVPSDLAYGDHPARQDGAPGGPLIFDVELLAVTHA